MLMNDVSESVWHAYIYDIVFSIDACTSTEQDHDHDHEHVVPMGWTGTSCKHTANRMQLIVSICVSITRLWVTMI